MSTTRKPAAKTTTTRKPRAKKETAVEPVQEVTTEDEAVAAADAVEPAVDEPTPSDDAAEAEVQADPRNMPNAIAALAKHGLDSDHIPGVNGFFDNGFVRVRGTDYGLVTDFVPWPSTFVRDEVLAAYRKDRA